MAAVPLSPATERRRCEIPQPGARDARPRTHGAQRGHPQAPALRQRGRSLPQGAALPPGHVPQGLPRRAPGAQGVSISTALLPAGRRRRRGGQPRRPLERRRRRPEREPAAEPRADAADAYAEAPPSPRPRADAPAYAYPYERKESPRYEPTGYEPTGFEDEPRDMAERLGWRPTGYYGAGSPSPSPPPPSPAPTSWPTRTRGPPGPDVQDAPLRLPAGRVPARRSM